MLARSNAGEFLHSNMPAHGESFTNQQSIAPSGKLQVQIMHVNLLFMISRLFSRKWCSHAGATPGMLQLPVMTSKGRALALGRRAVGRRVGRAVGRRVGRAVGRAVGRTVGRAESPLRRGVAGWRVVGRRVGRRVRWAVGRWVVGRWVVGRAVGRAVGPLRRRRVVVLLRWWVVVLLRWRVAVPLLLLRAATTSDVSGRPA